METADRLVAAGVMPLDMDSAHDLSYVWIVAQSKADDEAKRALAREVVTQMEAQTGVRIRLSFDDRPLPSY